MYRAAGQPHDARRVKAFLIALFCAASAYATPVTIDRVYADMIKWEGYRTQPYRDADGWSIGVGHALTRHGEPVKRVYTRAEVYQLFLRDLAVIQEACRAGVSDFDNLPQPVQLIALNVAWGVGPTGFARFVGFRRALSHRAYYLAASELGLSAWFHQVSPSRANWAIKTLRSY